MNNKCMCYHIFVDKDAKPTTFVRFDFSTHTDEVWNVLKSSRNKIAYKFGSNNDLLKEKKNKI